MKIQIINGPNLNLLGKREPEIYGAKSFETFLQDLKKKFPSGMISYFQSNHEGEIVDKIHSSAGKIDGIILNGGAFTHTSIAIADAISGVQTPVLEVHISNVYKRETFRHHSYLSAVCVGVIVGLGFRSYQLAVQYFLDEG